METATKRLLWSWTTPKVQMFFITENDARLCQLITTAFERVSGGRLEQPSGRWVPGSDEGFFLAGNFVLENPMVSLDSADLEILLGLTDEDFNAVTLQGIFGPLVRAEKEYLEDRDEE